MLAVLMVMLDGANVRGKGRRGLWLDWRAWVGGSVCLNLGNGIFKEDPVLLFFEFLVLEALFFTLGLQL